MSWGRKKGGNIFQLLYDWKDILQLIQYIYCLNKNYMKKYFALAVIAAAAVIFSNCNPGKKTADAGKNETPVVVKSTYEANMSALVAANCSPCHIPAKGGRKKPYDNYASVKTDIDEMIRRIELNPTERGFMPFKGTAKLPDSTIAAFKKWRDDGALEK